MRPAPVLALFAFGCTANGAQGMVVLGNTAPSGATCSFTGAVGQSTLSSGEISAASTVPYILTPLIQSRLTAGSGGEPVDRSILLSSANVQLTAGGASWPAFSSPVSGTLAPGGTINVSFPVIPVEILQTLNTGSAQIEVVSTTTIIGDEGGGQVNSEPFTYGITVCPDGAPCVVNDLGTCGGLVAEVLVGNPCNPFQDGEVDCCSDVQDPTKLICPAVSETAPGSGSAGSGM